MRRKIEVTSENTGKSHSNWRRWRFEDFNCLVAPDVTDESGEQRWHAIGAIQIEPDVAAVLLVVHAYREDHNGEEIIRIISARRAEKHEIRRYQKQAME
jgi:uncharacterized DUF497 family protein